MKFIKKYNESFNNESFFQIQKKLVKNTYLLDEFKKKFNIEYCKFEEDIKDDLMDLMDILPNSKLIFDKNTIPCDFEIENKTLSVQILNRLEIYINNVYFRNIGQDKILNQLKKFNSYFSNYKIKYSLPLDDYKFCNLNINDLSKKLLLHEIENKPQIILIEINDI